MTAQSPSDKSRRTDVCAQHGEYEARLMFGDRFTSCPTCAKEREAAAHEHAKAQRRADQIAACLRWSGIEGRYLHARLDRFEATTEAQQRVLAACRQYVDMVPFVGFSGLWLLGPVGTGKTYLGAAMVRSVIEEHALAAQIVTARGIVRRLRATWGKGAAETEEQVVEELACTSLMVLDEVGVGFGTEAEQTQLYDVIDRRYRHERPVVVISNLQPEQIKAHLGDRLYDRLRERAKAHVCDWPSYRGKAEP